MSDRERVLQCLRDAGSRGVHSHELRFAGISGNPSQRINELRDQGHLIEGKPERRNGRNGKRWILHHDAARVSGGASPRVATAAHPGRRGRELMALAGEPARSQLFDVEPEPINAALEDWDEAA